MPKALGPMKWQRLHGISACACSHPPWGHNRSTLGTPFLTMGPEAPKATNNGSSNKGPPASHVRTAMGMVKAKVKARTKAKAKASTSRGSTAAGCVQVNYVLRKSGRSPKAEVMLPKGFEHPDWTDLIVSEVYEKMRQMPPQKIIIDAWSDGVAPPATTYCCRLPIISKR